MDRIPPDDIDPLEIDYTKLGRKVHRMQRQLDAVRDALESTCARYIDRKRIKEALDAPEESHG